MTRSIETLCRDQQAILDSYREERDRESHKDAPAVASVAITGSEIAYGRVVEIVADGEDLGPHLVVMRQTWTGTPPVPADAIAPSLRCYPSPNRTVCDFEANQVVRICIMPAVIFAEPLP